MDNLMETCKRFCKQYHLCKDCPLYQNICINSDGKVLLGENNTVNDLVNFAYHIKAYADDLEL